MAQTTVRVSNSTRDLLRRLAAAERRPMQAIMAAALEAYRRERFLSAVNAGYAALREDKSAWAGVIEERTAWDPVLLDGLSAEVAGQPEPRRRPGRRGARRA